MDLSNFQTGDVVRVEPVQWSFAGSESNVVREVILEIEDVDGNIRHAIEKFEPGRGPSVETLKGFIRGLNRQLQERLG